MIIESFTAAMPLVYSLWALVACMVFLMYSRPVLIRLRAGLVPGGCFSEADWLRIGIVLVSFSNTWIRGFWIPWYVAGIAGWTDLKSSVGALSWTLFVPACIALGGYCCHLHARFLVAKKWWIAPALLAVCYTSIGAWMWFGGVDLVKALLLAFSEVEI